MQIKSVQITVRVPAPGVGNRFADTAAAAQVGRTIPVFPALGSPDSDGYVTAARVADDGSLELVLEMKANIAAILGDRSPFSFG